jgi:hypothetical protein
MLSSIIHISVKYYLGATFYSSIEGFFKKMSNWREKAPFKGRDKSDMDFK